MTAPTETVGRSSDAGLADAVALATAVHEAVTTVVRGKDEVVRLALVALLSGGHLLVEDLPGTGKTLLAKSLAGAIGGEFGRIQCTPDLLPTDITGTSVYSPVEGSWTFRAGPVFANVVLIDEINRASPRTQAALLEPMEEHQVSVDDHTHPLPDPFFCIATQNPFGQAGTFPLPESQLDRFAMVVSMGLPDRDAEREILLGQGGLAQVPHLHPVADLNQIRGAVAAVRDVYVAPPALEYVLDLVGATRGHAQLGVGASPRASVGLLRAAQAHAVVSGRTFLTPDDVQAVAGPALAHRVSVDGTGDTVSTARLVAEIVASVAVPRP